MDADIYFYALKDSVFKRVLKKINMPKGIHVHTAGTISINEFAGLATKFGVFYPVQTFSVDKLVDFRNIPICIEANNMEVQQKLYEIAGLISDKIYLINSEQRKKIHLAAIFACNFTNYMYDISSKILSDAGIDFEIIQPLIVETADKVQTLSPYRAQTGPAVRKDDNTIKQHISLLSKYFRYKIIYKLLTNSIYKRHHKKVD
jgi:predicted short-subunit dehydrogenase-like oxidoreductase (DUF2520 family)